MGYRQSRFNTVNVVLVLGLIALGYAGYMFGPAYWRKYQVQEVLDEVANRCRGHRNHGPEAIEAFEEDARKKIQALGIEESIQVRITVEDRHVVVGAEYTETVHHPIINRVSKLVFHPQVERARLR